MTDSGLRSFIFLAVSLSMDNVGVFVYITTSRAFELTKHEAENLAAYLRSGGFVVADNDQSQLEYGPAEASLRAMFKNALKKLWSMSKI